MVETVGHLPWILPGRNLDVYVFSVSWAQLTIRLSSSEGGNIVSYPEVLTLDRDG